MLAYSRATKSQTASFEQVDLNKVCEEALNNLKKDILSKNAEVQVDPLPTVKGVGSQFVQLFQNLIGNSIKYVSAGVQPKVRVSFKENADSSVVIEISDNGIGIDPKYTEQIFQPFKRLHNATEYEGTGIGLAICKKIIEFHQGKLTVKSQEGKGSKFIIAFKSSCAQP